MVLPTVTRTRTEPKRRFELLFRLYGPKKELFEKAWKLPDPEEAK